MEITVKLTAEVLEKVDARAEREGVDRAEELRRLLERGLAVEEDRAAMLPPTE